MGYEMKQTRAAIPSLFYVVMFIAGLVVILGGMMHARPIIVPFMMAGFVAIITSGPINWLRDKGIPLWLAIIIVLVLMASAFALVAFVVGSSVKEFLQNLPLYETKLNHDMDLLINFLHSKGVHIQGDTVTKFINPALAMKYAATLFNGFGSLVANGLVILLMVIFMLTEADGIPAKLEEIFGGDHNNGFQIKKFNDSVKEYMVIKSIVSLVTGFLVTVSLMLIGVDFPVLWGMLAFLFNFIPNIGSIIAAIPPVLLAIAQLGPGSALATAACYLAINVIMGNVVEPRVMGKGLGLSTLVVFLSLLFWGWILGPVGMFLSVVLTMKLKIMLDCNEETKWLGVLLGPSPTGK